MAVRITYDNIPSARRGDLFQDMSFWVSHRVPCRRTLLDRITNNGGKIVELEKNADTLIADDFQRDCPPNSYSWRFIDDSVKHAYLQLKDRYLIGPPPDQPRPLGGGRPAKSGRTPFTPADDAALAKWVLSHSTAKTGNAIYQEYEQINPNHTWQSWRNRYIKVLQNLPHAQLERLAASASEVTATPAVTESAPPTASTRKSESRPKPPPRARKTERSPRQSPPQTTPQIKNLKPSVEAPRPVASSVRSRVPTKAPESVPKVAPVDMIETESEGGDDDPRAVFYHDVQIFMQESGLEVEFCRSISGQSIDLWDMLQCVAGQNVPFEEVDWIKVAEELGYNWSDAVTAKDELRECFESVVMPVISATEELESDVDGTLGEAEDPPEPVVITMGDKTPPPRPYVPSSPPMGNATRKRSLQTTAPPSSDHRAKRRRLSPDAVIPSTPERVIQPTSKRTSPVPHSDTRREGRALQYHEAPNSPDAQQLPPLHRLAPQAEPETQDFYTAQHQSTPGLVRQETSFDITPSQQLHSEDFDATPIPFSVDKRPKQPTSAQPENPATRAEKRPTPSANPARRKPGSAARPTESPPVPSTSSSHLAPNKPRKRTLPASIKPSSSRPSVSTNGSNAQPSPSPARPPTLTRGFSNVKEAIEYYQSLGYEHRHVVEALRRTTMTPGGLAALVMQSLKDKNGIPPNYEGVWTDNDDKGLRLVMTTDTNASPASEEGESRRVRKAKKELVRLVDKHGEKAVELRKRFLEASGSA
ncbi:TRF2-interacting telomeric protein/Rap1 C terminal domain-containing protein [Stachybotrys elegans]|uniref:DNA-binding protein RAP1 n=1 Tax=Stachybotrys elegans TaxID=80388 RepID=A0A8K0SME1_9HYPO|nr:TRF2-interacting telomeric protein/Rap1 C terminal domain-containing protein [Stachybotrys elegans]